MELIAEYILISFNLVQINPVIEWISQETGAVKGQ